MMILVGCGNMGRAMLTGWIEKGVANPTQIHVVEPNPTLLEQAKALGVHVVDSFGALPQDLDARYIIFAVKPQLFDQIVPDYKKFAHNGVFLSVLAGIKLDRFKSALGEDAAIIRIMPNTPAAIGEGMLVYCNNAHVKSQATEFVEKLLAANGAVAQVDEKQMDAVTGLSGSGPAYVFHMIECMTKAGIHAGLDEATALLLAKQTVKGAAMLASSSNASPSTLREQVTSPNGTTAAGLDVLMRDGRMEKMMEECVIAARDRSIELGK